MNLKDFSDVEYINLITYKKDKTPITTPVWVANFSNSLVGTTSLKAGKVCNPYRWCNRCFVFFVCD